MNVLLYFYVLNCIDHRYTTADDSHSFPTYGCRTTVHPSPVKCFAAKTLPTLCPTKRPPRIVLPSRIFQPCTLDPFPIFIKRHQPSVSYSTSRGAQSPFELPSCVLKPLYLPASLSPFTHRAKFFLTVLCRVNYRSRPIPEPEPAFSDILDMIDPSFRTP